MPAPVGDDAGLGKYRSYASHPRGERNRIGDLAIFTHREAPAGYVSVARSPGEHPWPDMGILEDAAVGARIDEPPLRRGRDAVGRRDQVLHVQSVESRRIDVPNRFEVLARIIAGDLIEVVGVVAPLDGIVRADLLQRGEDVGVREHIWALAEHAERRWLASEKFEQRRPGIEVGR